MQVEKMIKFMYHSGYKIPSDMWYIDEKYFSTSKAQYIPIQKMDIFHVLRAFCKKTRNDDEQKEIKQSINNLKEQIVQLEERL